MRVDLTKFTGFVKKLTLNLLLVSSFLLFSIKLRLPINLASQNLLGKVFWVSLITLLVTSLVNKQSFNFFVLWVKRLILMKDHEEVVISDVTVANDEEERVLKQVLEHDNIIPQRDTEFSRKKIVFFQSGKVVPGAWPRLIRFFCLPILLLIFSWWLFSHNPFFKGNEFSVLVKEVKQLDYYSGGSSELLAGEKIKGKFKASDKGLSAIAVRINTFQRKNTDEVVFRLRKENDETWYFEKTYNADSFTNEVFFLFDFPKIIDSDKQTFYFELESIRGRGGNAIAVSKFWPVFRIYYQPLAKENLKKFAQFNSYLLKKANSLLDSSDFRFSLILSFSFFILYLAFLFLPKISQIAYLTIFVFLLFVFWEMFYTVRNYDFNYLILSFLWLIINRFFGFNGKLSVWLGILFLFFCSIFLLLGNEMLAEKTSVWAYLFLLVGVILSWVDDYLDSRKNVKQN